MGKRIFGLIFVIYMIAMGCMIVEIYQDIEMIRIYNQALELELPD